MTSLEELRKKVSETISLKGHLISINDLQERDYKSHPLTENERKAIFRYEKFRSLELTRYDNETIFHEKYWDIHALSSMYFYFMVFVIKA